MRRTADQSAPAHFDAAVTFQADRPARAYGSDRFNGDITLGDDEVTLPDG